MIVRLPKDFRPEGDPILLPEEEPFLVLKPVVDGVFLYSTDGKLVGQSIYDELGATVSIGDAKSYCVQKEGSRVYLFPLVPDKKAFSYELFGNVPGENYTLYEYRPGSRRPVVAARVTPEPLDSAWYFANLSEECNVFRTLLFAVTVSYVANRSEEGK